MKNRAQEGRIVKLERVRQQGTEGAAFLIWFRDIGEKEAAILNARQAGLLARGGQALCIPWRGEVDPPAARWTKIKDLSDDEQNMLHAELKMVVAAGTDSEPFPPHLVHLSDAALYSMLFGMAV